MFAAVPGLSSLPRSLYFILGQHFKVGCELVETPEDVADKETTPSVEDELSVRSQSRACACVCIHTYMRVCIPALCVWVHMRVQACADHSSVAVYSESRGLPPGPKTPIWLGWLSHKPQGFPCLHLPHAGIAGMCQHAQLFHGLKGLNSDPHAQIVCIVRRRCL